MQTIDLTVESDEEEDAVVGRSPAVQPRRLLSRPKQQPPGEVVLIDLAAADEEGVEGEGEEEEGEGEGASAMVVVA